MEYSGLGARLRVALIWYLTEDCGEDFTQEIREHWSDENIAIRAAKKLDSDTLKSLPNLGERSLIKFNEFLEKIGELPLKCGDQKIENIRNQLLVSAKKRGLTLNELLELLK